ncbi:hypothetical protein AVEN_154619-1 [Araneus ventricosus]|uniref:Uncharacterized protein n=1 Tax=Araneus ventricosus TaxID=182803 RepID=A0A4Y2JYE1_ARAVE|nr:hypothetical protein AVEN_154619-1 [Araneus ventricosus]
MGADEKIKKVDVFFSALFARLRIPYFRFEAIRGQFWNGLLHFEPRSDDESDTWADIPSPNFRATLPERRETEGGRQLLEFYTIPCPRFQDPSASPASAPPPFSQRVRMSTKRIMVTLVIALIYPANRENAAPCPVPVAITGTEPDEWTWDPANRQTINPLTDLFQNLTQIL